jgi:sulfite reductase (NADPH) hemoprotein beta-component
MPEATETTPAQDVSQNVSPNEILKAASPDLAGSIAQTLADTSADKFSNDDSQLLKFHGIYQQDDRDKRATQREFSLLVRTRQTGGATTPAQYLLYDRLAARHGNNTLRLTTRQTFQLHGVPKAKLRGVVRAINHAGATTLGTAGDINRNVTAPPAAAGGAVHALVLEDARAIARALLPTATAYNKIWLGADAPPAPDHPYFSRLPTSAPPDPFYGPAYLPRKFKIAFAIPPRNDTDVFTNDLAFTAVVEGGVLVGYNLAAGGGMGSTHGKTATFPRLATPVGFIPRGHEKAAALAAVGIHRDFGDRCDRRHARLKYLVEERGVAWFAEELAKRLGFAPEPLRAAAFTVQGDAPGWRDRPGGRKALTLFVETGRIKDAAGNGAGNAGAGAGGAVDVAGDADEHGVGGGKLGVGGAVNLKTALREVVRKYRPQIYLTPSQNLILDDIGPRSRKGVTALFAKHGVDVDAAVSPVRAAGLACPALPTCGFAITEAERVFPRLLGELEAELAALGLAGEDIVVRMTGCPNGCARPRAAEVGLVGAGAGKYHVFLGGGATGLRLNRLWREGVKLEDIVAVLRPVLARFKRERKEGETFGDFADANAWASAA